jgi:prophage regulatory protein
MSDSNNGSCGALLRLSQIIPTRVPVSKSTWWEGVRTGRFPKPVKLGPRITAWRATDIDALIRGGV